MIFANPTFEESEEYICLGGFFIQTNFRKVDSVWVLIGKPLDCQASMLDKHTNGVGNRTDYFSTRNIYAWQSISFHNHSKLN